MPNPSVEAVLGEIRSYLVGKVEDETALERAAEQLARLDRTDAEIREEVRRELEDANNAGRLAQEAIPGLSAAMIAYRQRHAGTMKAVALAFCRSDFRGVAAARAAKMRAALEAVRLKE